MIFSNYVINIFGIDFNNCYCVGLNAHTWFIGQGFGVAEGRPKEHLKNMANAAGQACRDYTPPGGETLEQVQMEEACKIRCHLNPDGN